MPAIVLPFIPPTIELIGYAAGLLGLTGSAIAVGKSAGVFDTNSDPLAEQNEDLVPQSKPWDVYSGTMPVRLGLQVSTIKDKTAAKPIASATSTTTTADPGCPPTPSEILANLESIDDLRQLGSKIRMAREAAGLTSQQFAFEIGVTFSSVSRWENARTRPEQMAIKALQQWAQERDTDLPAEGCFSSRSIDPYFRVPEKSEAAQKILAFRQKTGLTQQGIADELGTTFSTVSRWENAHVGPSKLAWRALEKLASERGFAGEFIKHITPG